MVDLREFQHKIDNMQSLFDKGMNLIQRSDETGKQYINFAVGIMRNLFGDSSYRDFKEVKFVGDDFEEHF